MGQHKAAKPFLLAVTFVAVLIITSVLYLNPSSPDDILKRGKSKVPDPSRNQPVSSPTSTGVEPSSTPAVLAPSGSYAAGMPIKLSGWKTHQDKEYKFEVQFPETFHENDGPITDSALPYRPLRKVHSITGRIINSAPLTIIFTVAVHNKPTDITLAEWFSIGYKTDLTKIEKGDIYKALLRAYALGGADSEGRVVSYQELQKENMSIFEVGKVWGGYLQYATYFTKPDNPYVYEISILLPFSEDDGSAKPSDSALINLFNQIVATFRFSE